MTGRGCPPAFTDGVPSRRCPSPATTSERATAERGPNTGGMGAYSLPPWLDGAHEPFIHERITEAAVAAMRDGRTLLAGVLYPGLDGHGRRPPCV